MLQSFFNFFLFLLPFFSQLEATNKFVVLTPPKCGTHLLIKALSNLLEKEETRWLGSMPGNCLNLTEQMTLNNGYVVAHNWDLKSLKVLVKRGYKVIFILRDPRDHAVSVLNWSYCPNWGGPSHILNIPNREKRLNELIAGNQGWPCYEFIKSRLNILKQLPKHSYYIARFENLVGPQGEGSRKKQIKELRSLCQFLNHDIDNEKIEEVADLLWGDSPSFYIGKIGQWKTAMTPFQIKFYHYFYQNELEYLKYETDDNWALNLSS